MNKVRLIIKAITGLILFCYPLVIYLSLKYQVINFAVLAIAALLVLRLITLPNLISNIGWLTKVTTCLGLLLALISWIFNKFQFLLYYPVATNLLFLIFFGYSLYQPQNIIEKFARLKDDHLPESAIIYTRKVTICWCLFFILNGSIALVTCLINDMYWWTMYNGLISYIFIGLLMGVEWIVRQKVKH